MIEAGAGATRLLRALVFVTACVMITTGAHALGGGEVSLPALALLAGACWPVALLSSAKRVTTPRLLLGLGAAQVVGHLLMSALGHAVPASVASVAGCLATSPHLGHAQAGAATCEAVTAPDTASSMASSVAGMAGMPGMPGMNTLSLSMVLSHVVAVTVLAYLLGRGEAVLWRVLAAVLPRLLAPVRFARPRPGLVITVSARPHRHLLLVVPRRGPPGAAL
ncbi:hypothetical protein BA895_13995 [Humibacillus sp. DSM 29435]|uniref:hypothetical protein n=1 Tax=Humibacillus sp. DSM 29435 TaxID=1869167 RepID=UPI00087241A4|nr:hypothetical protein [Humibacillus sp. DSM 29435]OFE17895.1 hypothetical protein BA895_13995 [Humibacillus sp. DSM 29435]